MLQLTYFCPVRWGGGAYVIVELSDIQGASQVAQGLRAYPPCRRRGFDPWVRKICWRRAGQLTAVSLPRESHGQRSLVGYSPWGHKDLDTIEAT